MASRRRAAALALATLASAAALLGSPSVPQARANVPCEIGVAPAAPITGALGIGNPLGDACNAVTDPALGAAEEAALEPISEAASSIGNSIFAQITSWATEGATWLLGEVVSLIQKTTTPNLLGTGFLRTYAQMAQIAAVMALLMLIFAVIESLGRGQPGMLWRVVLVNVPVAALATSGAYVVVQLLIATTDGFSQVITHATAHDTSTFFKGAVEALAHAGGKTSEAVWNTADAGVGTPPAAKAAGSAEVPLFVGLIAAMVAAMAAFCVWIELLMRSAAIYAVALFMPLALAASIWPRWASALRRSAELIVVLVFSKFLIVAIIALAASLAAHSGSSAEQVLTAGALLLVACFSPIVLFKLVPFAEGAVSSAFERQSAAGGAVRTIEFTSSVSMLRRTAFANWGSGQAGGQTGGAGRGKTPPGGGAKGGSPGGSGAGGGEAAASGAGGAAMIPVTASVGAAKQTKAT
ncbi:MAG TPA: hypothetical protein VF731_02375, partial [Solirubrobacterales bacterium]